MKKWRQSERRNNNQLRKRNTLKIKERLAATNQKEETLSKDQKGPQTNKTGNLSEAYTNLMFQIIVMIMYRADPANSTHVAQL